MIRYRAAFDTYEVIALHDVHLDDNNIVQTTRLGSIVVEAIVKGNINQMYIKDVFPMNKLHVNLHVSKFVFEQFEGPIQPK